MSDRVTGEPDVRLQRSFAMSKNGATKWYSDSEEDDADAAEATAKAKQPRKLS